MRSSCLHHCPSSPFCAHPRASKCTPDHTAYWLPIPASGRLDTWPEFKHSITGPVLSQPLIVPPTHWCLPLRGSSLPHPCSLEPLRLSPILPGTKPDAGKRALMHCSLSPTAVTFEQVLECFVPQFLHFSSCANNPLPSLLASMRIQRASEKAAAL